MRFDGRRREPRSELSLGKRTSQKTCRPSSAPKFPTLKTLSGAPAMAKRASSSNPASSVIMHKYEGGALVSITTGPERRLSMEDAAKAATFGFPLRFQHKHCREQPHEASAACLSLPKPPQPTGTVTIANCALHLRLNGDDESPLKDLVL